MLFVQQIRNIECLYLLTTVSNAVLDIHVQIFVCTYSLLSLDIFLVEFLSVMEDLCLRLWRTIRLHFK